MTKGRKTGGRKKIIGNCAVEGCLRILDSRGLCTLHYHRLRAHGTTDLINRGKTKTSVIHDWRTRDGYGSLPPEWKNDFWQFYKDVGEKPSKNHYLRKKDVSKPYSKDNFIWLKFIKREPGEDELTWRKRKWQQRLKNKPVLREYGSLFRGLLKATGISLEEYSRIYLHKSLEQSQLCAICGNFETAFNQRSKKEARLALDHCHKTHKIRDLLCSRCNRALGKLEESVIIIQAMITYIEKYRSSPTGITYQQRKNLDFFYNTKQKERMVCEICKKPETLRHKSGSIYRLSVDHCHKTNVVRGLLCARCNTTLGRMKESIPYLTSMIKYLEKHA